jgi:hypothetical protein
MICSIICGAAALLAVAAALFAAIVPATRGWAGLDDFLLRIGIIGVLCLISLIAGSLGLYFNEPYQVFLIIMVIIAAIPSIAFVIFAGMIIRKLL